MKKHVAIIVPGGIGAGYFNQGLPAIVNLINGLSHEFQITVYSMVAVDSAFEPEGFRLKSIQANHKQWGPRRMVKLIFMILKDHLAKRYDLFHGIWGGPSGMAAVFLAKCLRRPSVVSLRGGETAAVKSISYGILLNRSKKKHLFKTLHLADAVTALTKFQIDELKKHGLGKKEITVVPSGVDTSLFTVSEKDSGPPFHFLHVANLTEVKDQETLLKCFRILKDNIDCELRIAGADYLNGKIQKLCSDLKLTDSVSFLGSVKNSDLPAHFAWAHILLHTSLYEGQAMVVVEAAASKVLVCGTKTGLIADFGNNAISVNPGDYQGLADKVLALTKDKAKWISNVQEAYNWAKVHDVNYMVYQFSIIYNSLIK